MSTQVHTVVLSQSTGEFSLTLPIGAVLLDVDDVVGTLTTLGDTSASTESRSFVLAHKNSALPTGTLTFVGSFRADDESRLFLFEVHA